MRTLTYMQRNIPNVYAIVHSGTLRGYAKVHRGSSVRKSGWHGFRRRFPFLGHHSVRPNEERRKAVSASVDDARPPEGNRLLDALPEDELQRLRPYLETVALGHKDVIYEPGVTIANVYFSIDGVCSVIATMEDGQMVGVGTVGYEGMVGLPAFLGATTVPLACFCQVPGKAVRMSSEALSTEVQPGDRLHELLQRFMQATFVFTAQSSACNRLPSIE